MKAHYERLTDNLMSWERDTYLKSCNKIRVELPLVWLVDQGSRSSERDQRHVSLVGISLRASVSEVSLGTSLSASVPEVSLETSLRASVPEVSLVTSLRASVPEVSLETSLRTSVPEVSLETSLRV
jgi:hypothetical protein